MQIEHKLEGGKIVVKYQMEPHRFEAWRFDKPWRCLTGDGLMLSMVFELQDYKDKVAKYEALLLECHKELHSKVPTSTLKEQLWEVVGGTDNAAKS